MCNPAKIKDKSQLTDWVHQLKKNLVTENKEHELGLGKIKSSNDQLLLKLRQRARTVAPSQPALSEEPLITEVNSQASRLNNLFIGSSCILNNNLNLTLEQVSTMVINLYGRTKEEQSALASIPIEDKKGRFLNYYGAWVINKYFQQYVGQVKDGQ